MSYNPKKHRIIIGFGDRLNKAIADSGYSLTQIERLTGVNHSNIHDYCLEIMIPSAYTLCCLCSVLKVSADYLLGLEKLKHE